MKRSLALILLLCATSACRPTWVQMVDPPSDAPPEYRLGWEDGCDSGLSAEGSWSYKLAYGFKKRYELAANDHYKQGWNEGFTYCRFSLAASNSDHDFSDVGMGGGFQ